MQTLSTQPYKGTRDFYPEDMTIRNWIFNQTRKTLTQYGYQEYDGPMLEPFELYAAKTSEEIVNEQLYWLMDRGERKMAIRPEMTPTLARMVAARQHDLPKPIRWFSIPNLWRYERPQRGRLREHWQLNVDVFGGSAFEEDIEISEVIVALMEGFGANKPGQYVVKLNHRGISNHIFQNILKLSAEKIPTVARLLDGAGKMTPAAYQEGLAKEGLSQEHIQFMTQILDPNANLATQFETVEGFGYIQKLLTALKSLGLEKNFRFDPSLMRGFLYYTGLVLEVFDLHPDNNRALFGGGRYDNLVGLFGGTPLPGVGFGMGDVTIRNFLETHKLLPNFKARAGIYIACLGEAEYLASRQLAQALRLAIPNTPITCALAADRPKKVFGVAEKLGMRGVIFVGSQEMQSQVYSMKDLVEGKQHSGSPSEIAKAYNFLANTPVASGDT